MRSMRWCWMMRYGTLYGRSIRKAGWNGWFIWEMTGVFGKNTCKAEKFSDETGVW